MTGQHVFARISGFGLTIVPQAPYRAARVGDAVQVVHESPDGERAARLRSTDGTLSFELDASTKSLEDVADVARGPVADDWRIETAVFTACWPEGFEILSSPNPPGFDLAKGGDVLLYPQGPTRQPMPDERLVAPGQRVVAKGQLDEIHWVELSYEQDAREWKQRHYLVPFSSGTILVTLQAPASSLEASVPAAGAFARSIRPFER